MTDSSHQIRDLSPPGEILGEAMEERGVTGAELARRLGCTEKHVSQLVNGRVPLTTDMALQLEQVLGISAQFWNSLEFNYRSEQKRAEQRQGYGAFRAWMQAFPVAAMRKAGYLPTTVGQTVIERVEALLQFFGVTSPDAWEAQWQHATARFRKAQSFDPDQATVTAWLRRGEIEAARIACSPYDAESLRAALPELRGLTRQPPQLFQPRAVGICASAGVALTFVPALPKLALSGATRWIGDKAVVHLSLRHRTDDQLWFSFFHEICHVLEHKKSAIFLDAVNDHDGDPAEEKANEFAGDILLPPDRYAWLLSQWDGRSLAQIQEFANSEGIAPGIVVGRLQHDRRLPFTHGNKLKQSYVWDYEASS
ncbi:MAG: HigA family addiction module antidote protein [Planctomycetes bacterium]|nr:HigA family addiction module antidote protein [Planctomycetota bacterium]